MLRAPLRVAAVAGVSGALFAALSLEDRFGPMSDARRDAYVRRWARSLLKILGVEAIIDAPEGALARTAVPRLVVANHRSTLDILLLLDLFGGQLLARADMAGWPAIGPMARRAGTLFVDRGDPRSGAAAVQRIRERLRRGITISVFPEGTTFDGDLVREFQAGAFLAIARERGEVLPVGIAYERSEAIFGDEPVVDHMKRLVRAPRIRVAVSIGLPLATGTVRIRSLADAMHGDVQALVHRARERIGGDRS
jgi:1-acyl-sn-glycerol-3-phosphate acyltransferase